MAANNKSKQKLLHILRMLQEETDAEHGLTMSDIIARLAEKDINAERKSVYRDLEILRDFGIDIRTYQRSPVEYAIAKRDFELTELMLMVDAISSSKFLTERQSNALIRNIQQLASNKQRKQLARQIHVAGRVKSKNESVFSTIDVIHQALRERRKISFMYTKHDMTGKRSATRETPHIMTPVHIAYADDYYYLTCWNDKYEDFTEFRVDRMERVMITEEKATVNDQITHYMFDEIEHEYFGRFEGENINCTLHVQADKIDIVLDRFGGKAHISQLNENTAKASVKIKKSEQFFGWIASMGGKVRIAEPSKLAQDYRAYLTQLLNELS